MKKRYFIFGLLIISLFGCKGKEGVAGQKSLINLINEPAGTNCPTGGYKIISGIDVNNNNLLDASEIQSTKYICNGLNGSSSIASLIPEPAGPNCTEGGYKIITGIDLNNNHVLDANEIQNTQYICNGLVGNNSLVALVAEPAGPNCPNGGYKVNTGIDANKNGALDNNEIQNTTYICNGNNGLNYLIAVKAEPAGANCTYGGYTFNTGIDVNKNGILDNSEITAAEYICNNAPKSEVRLPLDFSANTTSATGVYGLALSNFNKANYPGLDSVVFVGRPYSGNTSNNSIVELIDMTDGNQVLAGSTISSNLPLNPNGVIASGNLYNSIPNKSINIGISVRSQINGDFSAVDETSYLILYFKN